MLNIAMKESTLIKIKKFSLVLSILMLTWSAYQALTKEHKQKEKTEVNTMMASAYISKIEPEKTKKLLDTCPTELMDKAGNRNAIYPYQDFQSNYKKCKENIMLCLGNCEDGLAQSCFNLAAFYDFEKQDNETAQTLYQKSCSLGSVNGCTNRAAFLFNQNSNQNSRDCYENSFVKTCQKGDAWGCKMYIRVLKETNPKNKAEKLKHAGELLKKACIQDSSSDAC